MLEGLKQAGFILYTRGKHRGSGGNINGTVRWVVGEQVVVRVEIFKSISFNNSVLAPPPPPVAADGGSGGGGGRGDASGSVGGGGGIISSTSLAVAVEGASE